MGALQRAGYPRGLWVDPRKLATAGLTATEVDVLRLVAAGHDVPTVAGELCTTAPAVQKILGTASARLTLAGTAQLVAYARHEGLI